MATLINYHKVLRAFKRAQKYHILARHDFNEWLFHSLQP